MTAKKTVDTRNRLNLTLPDKMEFALDRCSVIMGIPKTAVILQILAEGLPSMIERADLLDKATRGNGRK
jgi:hypothetical protein